MPRIMPRRSSLTPIFDPDIARGAIAVGDTPGIVSELSELVIVGNWPDVGGNDYDGAAVIGSHAYVWSSLDDSITSINLSDVTNPADDDYLTHANLDGISWAAAYNDRYLICACPDANLITVVDCDDPTNLVIAGTLSHANLNGVTSVAVYPSQSLAVCAVPPGNRVTRIDLSTPASPTYAATRQDNTNLEAAYAVCTTSVSRIIASAFDAGGPTGMWTSVTASSTLPVGETITGSPADTSTWGVFKDFSSIVFMAGRNRNSLTSIDCADADDIVVQHDLVDATNLQDAFGVTYLVGGAEFHDYIVVACHDSDRATLLKVTDPTSMSVIHSITDPQLAGASHPATYQSGRYIIFPCSEQVTVVEAR